MASSLHNLSDYDPSTVPTGKGKKFGIVVADWNSHITYKLLHGCIDTLLKYEVSKDDISICHVPGTFELPFGARRLLADEKFAGIVCIGCVIKGETPHNDYINHSVAHALQDLNLNNNIPFIFGVLTPNNEQQALDRAGGKYGNKGVEAAVTVLKMASL